MFYDSIKVKQKEKTMIWSKKYNKEYKVPKIVLKMNLF